MSASRVTEHVWRVPETFANVFLIVLPEGITMVDAGLRRGFPRIARALRDLGRRPDEVKDIVVTHMHADHTGGLAEARAATGARVWMHPLDARMTAAGEAMRPSSPSPGSFTGRLFGVFAGITTAKVAPVAPDGVVNDREEIPVAGGLLPIWTPGHTEGHVSYLWPGDRGVLFVGDAAGRSRVLRASPIYEDYQRGLRSLRELAAFDFQTACFSHGRPLTHRAAEMFANAWGRAAMIHADAALARDLEAFICREWRELAGIAAALWPDKDVATMDVDGGVALWLGDGGLVNVAAGMGMEHPVGEGELRLVEDFYARRDAPPMLATCPFADPSLFAALGKRGWQITEFENVLAMELPSEADAMIGLASKLPPQIDLRVCATPAERAVFGRVAARGFSDYAEPGAAHLEFGEMMAAHEASILVLAWVDGQPAGTGALKIDEGIAWLSADSTLPLFRRRGIQQALQRFRLQLAWAAGSRLAVIESAVGSASQRNMERLGFRVVYPHLHFAKV